VSNIPIYRSTVGVGETEGSKTVGLEAGALGDGVEIGVGVGVGVEIIVGHGNGNAVGTSIVGGTGISDEINSTT